MNGELKIKPAFAYTIITGILGMGIWLGVMYTDLQSVKTDIKRVNKYALKIAIELGIDVSNLD